MKAIVVKCFDQFYYMDIYKVAEFITNENGRKVKVYIVYNLEDIDCEYDVIDEENWMRVKNERSMEFLSIPQEKSDFEKSIEDYILDENKKELKRLEVLLCEAEKEEDYEHCARLRDKINKLI